MPQEGASTSQPANIIGDEVPAARSVEIAIDRVAILIGYPFLEPGTTYDPNLYRSPAFGKKFAYRLHGLKSNAPFIWECNLAINQLYNISANDNSPSARNRPRIYRLSELVGEHELVIFDLENFCGLATGCKL